jgi:molecular chaperone GrpE (heat shock protein)
MTQTLPQDTPIRRASIAELPIDEIEKLVEQFRERRMRSYTAFEAAQQAKAKMKEEKDKERYSKLLVMLEKKIETIDKALEAAGKYVTELKVLELVLGD